MNKPQELNHTTLRRKCKSKSLWSWVSEWCLRYETQSTSHKRRYSKLDFIRIKNICFKPHHLQSEKTTYRWGENICQYLNGDLYPEYMKNSCNKKTSDPIKNCQRIWIEISPRWYKNDPHAREGGTTSWVIREMYIKTTWNTAS